MNTITNDKIFIRYVFLKNTVVLLFIIGLSLSLFFEIKDYILLIFTPLILTFAIYEYFFSPSFITITKVNDDFEITFYNPENKYFYTHNKNKLRSIVVNHRNIDFIIVNKSFGLQKLMIKICEDDNGYKFLKPIAIHWLRIDKFQDFLNPKLLIYK
ncbi:MAG TPA: hypothetical protein PKD85_11970 [Saprospiraceae bacterium]|nr:hypothetical protein [Saprospiraceae bacterium]